MIAKKYIKVAAGVLQNEKNEILFCSRKMPDGKIMWEFPGGKIEKNETASNAARRELAEELNLEIFPADTMYITVFEYPDKTVELHFIRCFCFDYSSMQMLDGQNFKWQNPQNVSASELLLADRDFLKFLQMRQ